MLCAASRYPALRSRLLGGAAPWKYKVQGFLYYQVAGWFCDKSNANADTRKNCYNGSFVDEQGGPRTAWKPCEHTRHSAHYPLPSHWPSVSSSTHQRAQL